MIYHDQPFYKELFSLNFEQPLPLKAYLCLNLIWDNHLDKFYQWPNIRPQKYIRVLLKINSTCIQNHHLVHVQRYQHDLMHLNLYQSKLTLNETTSSKISLHIEYDPKRAYHIQSILYCLSISILQVGLDSKRKNVHCYLSHCLSILKYNLKELLENLNFPLQ